MVPSSHRRVPRAAWFGSAGPDSDVVISTRCRIARNLENHVFPHRADPADLASSAMLCRQAIAGVEPNAVVLERDRLSDDAFRSLVIGRYVTFRWIASDQPGTVHVDPAGRWSVMVHEEDHLRIQAVAGGFAPEAAMEPAQRMAERIGRHLRLAHRPELGYLTASLSNAGTGLRLSFLLHVPALAQDKSYVETLMAAEQMGCSVRGAFGEGTRGTGAVIQMSNRHGYGPGARNAVDRAIAATRYVVEREREARGALLARQTGLEDLQAACEGARSVLLTSEPPPEDVFRCVSVLRLGMALGATKGDVVRTGEWMALAGVTLWAGRHGGRISERFERVRSLAKIRMGLHD